MSFPRDWFEPIKTGPFLGPLFLEPIQFYWFETQTGSKRLDLLSRTEPVGPSRTGFWKDRSNRLTGLIAFDELRWRLFLFRQKVFQVSGYFPYENSCKFDVKGHENDRWRQGNVGQKLGYGNVANVGNIWFLLSAIQRWLDCHCPE